MKGERFPNQKAFLPAVLTVLPAVLADAIAVAANVTVVQPSSSGDLRLYPSGITPPPVSTINFAAGQTLANNALLDLTGMTPGESTSTAT